MKKIKLLHDFREFATKGNLVDLAVGFVMGSTFAAVSNSFINGIIMPIVGLISGKDFHTWKFVLKKAQLDAAGAVQKPEIAILYGDFISVLLNFIVIAFVMFLLMKAVTMLRKKQETPPAPPAPNPQEVLLTEIRDLLKNKP